MTTTGSDSWEIEVAVKHKVTGGGCGSPLD
jgi:hypothetical protein